MKTIQMFRYMITIFLVVISVTLSAQVTLGGTTVGIKLPFDSVENYAATNSSVLIDVAVIRENPDGTGEVIGRSLTPVGIRFTSKAAMEAVFQSKLALAFTQAVGTTKTNVDFTRPLLVYGDVTGFVGEWVNSIPCVLFFHYSTIQFAMVDGHPVAPTDLSSYRLTLQDRIPFYIPGIKWAILQDYDAGGHVFNWVNTLLDPNPEVVDTLAQVLFISTSSLVTNSPNRLKVIFGTGDENKYRVLDGFGAEKPEIIPIRTEIVRNLDKTYTVKVYGGDSWRTLVLEESTDLVHWTETLRRVNYYDFSTTSGKRFEVKVDGVVNKFFRVKGL